jgi:hypothetical protein
LRNHRTAVFIEYHDHDEYGERFGRLLESFNNTNIKVDIYFFSSSSSKKPSSIDSAFWLSSVDIEEFCQNSGYVMKMIVTPGFAKKNKLPSEEEIADLLKDLKEYFG